jgi:hypothetical protein
VERAFATTATDGDDSVDAIDGDVDCSSTVRDTVAWCENADAEPCCTERTTTFADSDAGTAFAGSFAALAIARPEALHLSPRPRPTAPTSTAKKTSNCSRRPRTFVERVVATTATTFAIDGSSVGAVSSLAACYE